ncbi:hypothetical protein DYD21_20695 [Rhodohalobacter sp. SW132]|uniref:hypothetical protein n=1 Tax=Rhodohalobacter sp. SW132 TaxID=2293433 RepID=UPI000E231007|nr:hypothetical protein [Rhodohalobacter sp. SW132]REL23924.1 hypothetical protein DYD21_20695 [Rhodohalobacter sp. SW132]
MLIRAYGSFWNPDIVDWGTVGAGNKGSLVGKVKIKKSTHKIDFWDAVAIYVLHDQFKTVYIGKAYGSRLGPRLRDHLTDRFAGRWDMFSWFTLSTVNTVNPGLRAPGTRQVNPETILNTLEALSIAITDPALNRKRESIPKAIEAIQVGDSPKAIRSYLEEILEKIDQ